MVFFVTPLFCIAVSDFKCVEYQDFGFSTCVSNIFTHMAYSTNFQEKRKKGPYP